MTRVAITAAVVFAALAGTAAADDATTKAAPAASARTAAPARYAAWLSIPSIDGAAGAELGVERAIAPRLAIAVQLGARKSATGDYDGLTFNAGAELRWYWRGHGGWRQPAGTDRVGWFIGARIDAARTSLTMDDRDLGALWTLGTGIELGYRLTPWRGLAVTGLVTAEQRVELGDAPAWRQGTIGVGLEVGWMF